MHQREQEAGPKHFAVFSPAPDFKLALGRVGKLSCNIRIHFALADALIGINEGHVPADGLGRGIAKQALRAVIPTGDQTGEIQRNDGALDMVEYLQLLTQLLATRVILSSFYHRRLPLALRLPLNA